MELFNLLKEGSDRSMPKLNTHLYFAKEISDSVAPAKLRNLLKEYRPEFLLGNIFPDIFYYSFRKKNISVSDHIHGENGIKTNKLIFDILDIAKERGEHRLLVFVWGMLAHFALDAKIHPLVYYLTGNYYDHDTQRRVGAVRQHFEFEVVLDMAISKENYLENFNANLYESEVFALLADLFQKMQIRKKEIVRFTKRAILIESRIVYSRAVYKLVRLLEKSGIIEKKYSALFYPKRKNNLISLSKKIEFHHPITGYLSKRGILDLLQEAQEEFLKKMNVAHDYYLGKINRRDGNKVITGENLNFGQEGVWAKDAKFFLKSGNWRDVYLENK